MKQSFFLLPILLSASLCAAAVADTVTLQWQESGLTAKTAGMRPSTVAVSETAPPGIKKAPANLAAPRYGSFQLGPAAAKRTFLFIVDEVDGKPARLFVDAKADGDFTNDPVGEWKATPATDPDGGPATSYSSSAVVEIPFASGPRRGQVNFNMLRTDSKYNDNFKNHVTVYADYGLVGEVKLGDRTIPAALQDGAMAGEFRLDGDVMHTPLFWLALTNGPRGHVGQSFVASRPLEVEGKWWALTNMTPEGSFAIVPSAKPAKLENVSARPEAPNLTGKQASAFTGPLLGGKTVNFPSDYKGKIVLLDFWATWCGPCVRELPNVVAAYGKYHDRGLEVLGVSLDKEGAEQKLADFTKKNKMPWPQVYDGKYWNAEVARLYQVHSIPRIMLVDGDSGVILDDDSLHGEALAPAIEKALAGKKR